MLSTADARAKGDCKQQNNNFERTTSSSSSSNEISINESNASSINNLEVVTSSKSLSSCKSSSIENESNNIKCKSKKLNEIPKEITSNTIQQKRSRFLKRLSSQTNSFFSKSCPVEELSDPNGKLAEDQKQSKESNEKQKTLNKIFSFANTHKLLKSTSKKSFDTCYDSATSNDKKTFSNSTGTDSVFSISNFEIDIEKLTRELAMPSIDKPLTSFKKIDSFDEEK